MRKTEEDGGGVDGRIENEHERKRREGKEKTGKEGAEELFIA